MPRYAILEHDHPFLHWDLMLEAGSALRTWRLSALPAAGLAVVAEPLGDHRVAYLDYEGPVSGNRGKVVRWDRGLFEWLEEKDGLATIQLRGERLLGVLRVQRHADGTWSACLEPGDGPRR